MDSNPTFFNFATPKGDHLEPPLSSHSIETSSYELHPGFIAMVREQSFSRDKDESPSSHLRKFKQLCSCLVIAGMSQDILALTLGRRASGRRSAVDVTLHAGSRCGCGGGDRLVRWSVRASTP
jgi:hypothetical protein